MANYDNDIIKITNWLLQQLPANDPFIFDDEYQKLKDSINVQADTRFYWAVTLFGDKVLRFMNSFGYFDIYKDGRDVLSDKGREAKRLGHDEYKNRVVDIQDGEWYKSKLAQQQFEDYPNVVKRSWISIIIAGFAILIALITLWIKSKCQ
jgi:hypothetical protein